ncbi:hypothetical protein ACEWY4_009507 [Coilia grayii]|uniref:Uncharacterized protein n=1 Tax=Coilia grayii TaxID=363190 RepID=A0ABD1K7A1_9TELE
MCVCVCVCLCPCVHSGKYAYYIGLNVGGGPCPEADNVRSSKRGDFFRLDCEDTMDHITRVFSPSFVTWLKECKPLAKGTIIDLKLQIENVQPVDGGRYTCVLGFTHEGRNYTSARTTTVTVEAPIRRLKPEIIVPLNETRAVKMGSQQELRCEATGMPDEITTVIWQINGTPDEIMNSPDFTVSKVHGNTSVLTIIEVKTKFLNVPFTCLAQNRLGSAISTLVLTEANEGHPSWLVAIICLCVLLVVCALLWQFFKVDLVLLYRSLCPRQHRDTDGKHYDAYVSYPYESQGLSVTFALGLLPEVLENKYGYKLFIRGRDDDPGEDAFEVVVSALQESRRVILVLEGTHTATYTSKNSEEGRMDSHADPVGGVFGGSWDTHEDPVSGVLGGGFEQNMLVHDALLRSGLKVIIIQTGHRKKENLPAFLSLLKHSKRVLYWHTQTHTNSKRRFWKELRYLMPVAGRSSPSSTTQTTHS